MQKKIIALAIAAAMTAPAMAFAEATLSGQINMSYDGYTDGAASSTNTNRLNSNNSRIIWKGSEDMGGGLSTIWQLDARVQVDNGTNSSTNANQIFAGNNYLGLKSDTMGALMAGRIDAPYKVATRNLDVFFDTAGDNRSSNGAGIAGLLSEDLRLNNAIAYVSPDMSGFTVALASVFGAESASSASPDKGSAYSLAAMYNAGPWNGSLSYQDVKYGSNGSGDLGAALAPPPGDGDKNTAIKLGGGYKVDAFVVNALFEQTSYTTQLSGIDEKRSNYYVGGRYNVTPNDGIRVAYTKRGASTGNTDDANQYAIGYERVMSKATTAYVTYVKTTDNATNAPDPSDISIGMKHSF